jgi:hypothetical protein
MRPFLICLLMGLMVTNLCAQDTLKTTRGVIDGEQIETQTGPRREYNPKVAARRSAIIPGWGQVYNGSWWKVPIIYGGLGACIYFIDYNNQQYRFYVDALEGGDLTDPNQVRQAQRLADYWRRSRDLVFLTTIGVYALQILEASIDAHLKGFDVDEQLALNIKPKIGVINNGVPYIGAGITLAIGK